MELNPYQVWQNKFHLAEKELGITRQNFQNKFVYTNQSQQSNQAYLLPRFNPCPSQLAYFTSEQIQIIVGYSSQLIFQAGILLKVPVSTTIVAQSIMHFFYSRKSFIDYDFRDIIMGSMFLACKSEQTLRKTYQVGGVFDQIFKIEEGNKRPVRPLEPNSTEYNSIKNTIMKSENNILFELGFEVYRLFDVPHRYLGGMLNAFDKHPKAQMIASKAWGYVNDIYLTRMCLFYPGQMIAASAIYLSLKSQQINFPAVSWWCLLEANEDIIQDIISELLAVYEKQSKMSLENVSSIIKQVSQTKHGFVNVFPVPYYRKIMLENRNKIKISIKADKIQNISIKAIEQSVQKIGNEKEYYQKNRKGQKDSEMKKQKKQKNKKDKQRERSREKNKNKEKSKSKHKKKNKKESRSSSRSSQRNNQKYQSNNNLKDQGIYVEAKQKEENTIQVKKLELNKLSLLSQITTQLKKHQAKMQTLIENKQESSDSDDDEILAELKKKIATNKTKKQQQDPQNPNDLPLKKQQIQ